MPYTDRTIETAKGIIRDGLNRLFLGEVEFDSITIMPRPGPQGTNYLDVVVDYGNGEEHLTGDRLNSLYETIADDLRAIGIEESPPISYRDRSEVKPLEPPKWLTVDGVDYVNSHGMVPVTDMPRGGIMAHTRRSGKLDFWLVERLGDRCVARRMGMQASDEEGGLIELFPV